MIKEKMSTDQIKRLRHNIYHLTQPEFSQLMGTCVATISRWESGRTSPTSLSLVILEAFQQAVDNYGEQRIRGVDWSVLLERRGMLHVLAGVFNFATTIPSPPTPDDVQEM